MRKPLSIGGSFFIQARASRRGMTRARSHPVESDSTTEQEHSHNSRSPRKGLLRQREQLRQRDARTAGASNDNGLAHDPVPAEPHTLTLCAPRPEAPTKTK